MQWSGSHRGWHGTAHGRMDCWWWGMYCDETNLNWVALPTLHCTRARILLLWSLCGGGLVHPGTVPRKLAFPRDNLIQA